MEDEQENQSFEKQEQKEIVKYEHILSEKANAIANRANLIAFLGFLLALGVLYYTFELFKETAKANETTRLALQHQISKDSADDIAKAKQDIKDDKKHREDSTNNRIRFTLDSASTQAQINAFKDQGKRFAKENEIKLQVDSFEMHFDYEVSDVFIHYKLNNFSNISIFLTSEKIDLVLTDRKRLSKSEIKQMLSKVKDTALNMYIDRQGQSINRTFYKPSVVYLDAISELRFQRKYAVIIGQYNYKDPIDNVSKSNFFAVRYDQLYFLKPFRIWENWTENN